MKIAVILLGLSIGTADQVVHPKPNLGVTNSQQVLVGQSGHDPQFEVRCRPDMDDPCTGKPIIRRDARLWPYPHADHNPV